MTVGALVKMAGRSILRNRMRSLLTSLGIIIGVCSVIVMVAIGAGSQQRIERQIASMGTNLLMVFPERGFDAANRLTRDDEEKLQRESAYLRAISGTVRAGGATIRAEGSEWSTTVTGVTPDYLAIKEWVVREGEMFGEWELSSRSKVAVLGATVAEELFGGQQAVGRSIRINLTPFTVIGVLESRGNNAMGQDQDDVALVPLTTAMTRLTNTRTLSSIEMSVVNRELMNVAETEIEQILRESHHLPGDAENDFRIISQSQIVETATQTSRTLTLLLAAIAGVSLLVGGIGIMNIMLVSVTERTREIGIRMSVGARKSDILLQFLSESVILSMAGGAIGILAALALSFVLGRYMDVPAIVQPGIVAVSALFAAAVGIFFGFYPARKAASLYPIDALRYE